MTQEEVNQKLEAARLVLAGSENRSVRDLHEALGGLIEMVNQSKPGIVTSVIDLFVAIGEDSKRAHNECKKAWDGYETCEGCSYENHVCCPSMRAVIEIIEDLPWLAERYVAIKEEKACQPKN